MKSSSSFDCTIPSAGEFQQAEVEIDQVGGSSGYYPG